MITGLERSALAAKVDILKIVKELVSGGLLP